jgi:sirohydrochlorin ferrochelatase
MTTPIVFLIDNGSLRPQATFWLRCLAEALSARMDLSVQAVSLLHSHKIPADELGGQPATIVKRRLRECLEAGHRDFVCLPLFLGPSLAISTYLPELIEAERGRYPDIRVRIAPVLAGPDVDAPDPRLASILAEQVRKLHPERTTKIALVDHGTPIREVNRVRNAVAKQLAETLGPEVAAVQACSMERREGVDYAFNDPLLESLGGSVDQSTNGGDFRGGRLILAMFFILPGRHAGEGGDVSAIADGLIEAGAFGQIETTALLGEDPRILDILEDRVRAVI